ncbi:MAG: rhodanese-related sulfurtransferase [Gammaproteobacteria bacterium]|jgi:rhodanese-related sulfurtransferase
MFDQLTEFTGNHPMMMMAFMALLVLTVLNEVKLATQRFAGLTPASAVQKMNNEESAVVLDVREPAETAGGKISKAVQIPVSSIKQRIGELDRYKNSTIIVYCKTGNRSSIACKALNQAGFEKVYNLNGGITAWQDAQLPVSKK